jgi:putative endonuclease
LRKPGTKKEGDRGEAMAAEYLMKNGFLILQRNYRYQRGEIDIIANDGEELVFVEVKTRHSEAFGTPEESITSRKEDLLKRTAEGYCFEHQIDRTPCRFDVVAIEQKKNGIEIRHIKNAF